MTLQNRIRDLQKTAESLYATAERLTSPQARPRRLALLEEAREIQNRIERLQRLGEGLSAAERRERMVRQQDADGVVWSFRIDGTSLVLESEDQQIRIHDFSAAALSELLEYKERPEQDLPLLPPQDLPDGYQKSREEDREGYWDPKEGKFYSATLPRLIARSEKLIPIKKIRPK